MLLIELMSLTKTPEQCLADIIRSKYDSLENLYNAGAAKKHYKDYFGWAIAQLTGESRFLIEDTYDDYYLWELWDKRYFDQVCPLTGRWLTHAVSLTDKTFDIEIMVKFALLYYSGKPKNTLK